MVLLNYSSCISLLCAYTRVIPAFSAHGSFACADAYYMFCRGQWEGVQPDDKDLIKYHEWLRATGGHGAGLAPAADSPAAAAATAAATAVTAAAAAAGAAAANYGEAEEGVVDVAGNAVQAATAPEGGLAA